MVSGSISTCIILALEFSPRKVFAREVGNISQGDNSGMAPKFLENLCYTPRVHIIRSSDIGTYLYCRRAWWYKKQGVEPANQDELAAGTELHVRHGRQVLASSITRTVGLILLMIALVMLVAYCTAQIV
jgi:hypothetical protein